MATSITTYGGWNGGYRLSMTLARSSVSVANNTSTINSKVWINSDVYHSFWGISSIHNQWIDGYRHLNGYTTNRAVTTSGSTLVMDNSRTVTHNSSGNRSVYSEANFRNAYVPEIYVSATLAIDRIDQLPNAPGSAPTVTSSGLTVTVTSATAGANGGTITGYEGRRRAPGGSWSTFALNTSTRKGTFSSSGGVVEVQTRAKTARGWGPYSGTRTHTVGTAPDAMSVVNIVSKTNGTFTISWSAPPNGGLPITRYESQFYNYFTKTWSTIYSPGTQLFHDYHSATNGLGYKFRARAVNQIGAAPWTESNHMVTMGCTCVAVV